MSQEGVRMLVGHIVTAKCIDCGDQFCGEIGVRFLKTPEGDGLEIVISADAKAHAIGRVQYWLIPTIEAESLG